MGYSPEQAINYLAQRYGISKGDAILKLKQARDEKDPFTDQISGVDDYLENNLVAQFPRTTEFLAGAADIPAKMLGLAALPFSREPLQQVLETEKQLPTVGPNIPLLGNLYSGAGTLVGAGEPFKLLEHIAEPLAAKYAAMRVPGSLLKSVMEGAPQEEVLGGLGKEAASGLAKASNIYTGAKSAISGGLIGAISDPEHPLQGAAVGGILGRGVGTLQNVFAKPLAEFKNHPDLGKAINFLAGYYHERPEVTAARYRNLAEVQADLASKNAEPLNPEHFYSPQEWDDALGPSGKDIPSTGTIDPERKGLFEVPGLEKTSPVMGPPEPMPEKYAGREFYKGLRRKPNIEVTPSVAEEQTLKTDINEEQQAAINRQEARERELAQEEADLGLPSKVTKRPSFSISKEQNKLKTLLPRTAESPEILRRAVGAVSEDLNKLSGELEQLGKARSKSKNSFRKMLSDERGALGGERTPRKPIKPISPEEARSILETLDSPTHTIAGADIDPDVVLGNKDMKAGIRELARAGWMSIIDLPAGVLSKDVNSAGWIRRFYNNKTLRLFHQVPQLNRRAEAIGKEFDLHIPERAELFHKANQGLKSVVSDDPSGKPRITYQQTNDVPDWATDAAKRWHKDVASELFRHAAGYKPEAEMIVKSLGIGPDSQTGSFSPLMRKLKAIQDGTWNGRVSALDQQAADLTNGLIQILPSHDKSIQPYDEGVWSLLPIPHEKRVLEETVRSLEDQLKLGQHGTKDLSQIITELKQASDRLKQLEKEQAQKGAGAFPGQDVLPHRQWYNPLDQAREAGGQPFNFDTDFNRMSRRVIYNTFTKRMFDEALWDAHQILPKIKDDGSIKKYLVNYLQAQRGVRAYYQDQWVRNLSASLTKFGVPGFTEDKIRNISANIMKWQVMSRLFMGFRFPIVNSTQTLLTVFPFVSFKNFTRASMRTIADFMEFLRMEPGSAKNFADIVKAKRNVWVRGMTEGWFDEGGEQFLREAKAMGHANFLDSLIEKWPTARLAEWTERYNRVMSTVAFEMEKREPGFKMPAALKKFYPYEVKVGTPSFEDVKRYGRAGREATQFILSSHGKPMAFSGGAAQRLVGQFRSFSIGYGRLFLDSARNKEWDHTVKMITAAHLLGGATVFPLYSTLRSFGIRHGLNPQIPDSNAFSLGLHLAGLNDYPHFIDITGSLDPLNLPFSLTEKDLVDSALGPTIGSLANVIGTGMKEGFDSKKFGKALATAVLPTGPLGVPGLEAAKMAQNKGLMFSERGKVVGRQTPLQIAGRGAGLMPPPATSGYYQHYQDIKDALQSGNMNLVRRFIKTAERDGYFITDKDLQQMQTQLKNESKTKMHSVGDMIR